MLLCSEHCLWCSLVKRGTLMGYGNKGWFKTYITMMANSFEYARNSASKHDVWIARAFSLLFSIIWYIFTIIVFIILPLAIIVVPIILLVHFL